MFFIEDDDFMGYILVNGNFVISVLIYREDLNIF